MAAKNLVNLIHPTTVEGINQTTINVLTASGTSREFGEFASADAVVFYVDCSAVVGSGSLQFAWQERDPATELFFTASDAPAFAAITGVLGTPLRYVQDPCYGDTYQLAWTITGFTSASVSVVGQLITRGH